MICYPHSLGFATWSHKPTGLFYGPWTGESEIMKKKLPAGYVGGFPFFAHESHHEFWWSSSHSFQKSQHILTVCWKNFKKKHISQYRGYPPDSLETSTLASMISQPPRCPGAAAFPATTEAAKADLSAACSSCRDCCQLQTLILGKRHKDQRFQWKVNLKIIWLWVKICQNRVPQ